LLQFRSSGCVHGTDRSASTTRIMFEVPSIMCRMSVPRVGSNGVLMLSRQSRARRSPGTMSRRSLALGHRDTRKRTAIHQVMIDCKGYPRTH
jgi:hypothetical protein